MLIIIRVCEILIVLHDIIHSDNVLVQYMHCTIWHSSSCCHILDQVWISSHPHRLTQRHMIRSLWFKHVFFLQIRKMKCVNITEVVSVMTL